MNKWIKIVFYSLVAVLIMLLVLMSTELISLSPYLFPTLVAIFSLLGVALVVLSLKTVKEKRLRLYLLINGISALGIIVFSVLHNVFYGLESLVNSDLLVNILSYTGVFFFILSITLCPIAFIVSLILVIVFLVRKK